MKKIVIVIQALIVLSSCARHKEEFQPVELTYIDSLRIESFVDSFSVISLELTEESILNNISRVISHDNKYILVDNSRTTKAITIFDDSGRFIRRISHFGRGPGEYLSITAVDISYKDHILYLYDNQSRSIFVYNTQGDYFETINVNGVVASDFKLLNNSTFAFYSPDEFSSFNRKTYPKGLIVYNKETNSVVSPVSYSKDTEIMRAFNSGWFTQGNDGQIGLLSSVENRYYHVKEDEAELVYSFKFPNKEIGLTNKSDVQISKAYPAEAGGKLFFYIFYKDASQFFPVIFDKVANHGYVASSMLGWFNEALAIFQGVGDKSFISVVYPHDLSEMAVLELKNRYNISIANNDNPLLIIYHLKN